MTLAGSIPGDLGEFSLELKQGDAKVAMNDEMGEIYVITDLGHGVFTLAVGLADDRRLLLFAIPKTVKAQGEGRRLFKAAFDAILMESPLSEERGDVKLHCTLEHSV